jgi:hypothetical protein
MALNARPPAPSDPVPIMPSVSAPAPVHLADPAAVRPRVRRLVVFTGRLA